MQISALMRGQLPSVVAREEGGVPPVHRRAARQGGLGALRINEAIRIGVDLRAKRGEGRAGRALRRAVLGIPYELMPGGGRLRTVGAFQSVPTAALNCRHVLRQRTREAPGPIEDQRALMPVLAGLCEQLVVCRLECVAALFG